MKSKKWFEFFYDAKGHFTIYSIISLLSGFTLVTSPLIVRICMWQVLNKYEIISLTFIYCIVALSDSLLALFINKMPDLLKINTVENMNLGENMDCTTALPEQVAEQLPYAENNNAEQK